MKKIFLILTLLIVFSASCTMRENHVLEEFTGIVAEESFESDKLLKVLIPELSGGKSVIMMLATGECILVDCGSSDDFPDLYERLKKYDINVIDCIILTSQSDCASGGLEKIAENFDVCQIFVSEDMKDTNLYRRIQSVSAVNDVLLHSVCEGTRIYDFGNMCIDVVSTGKYAYGKETDALCLYIVCGNRALFIEGECDIAAEAKMATELKAAVKSDILIIPYSGTQKYQSQYFLEETDPDYAVIPVYNDSYPSSGVLDKLKGREIVRTDINGDIMFITNGDTLKIKVDK